VWPGVYHERLVLDKPVEIAGSGPVGSVVLVGLNGPAIEASCRLVCRVANLHIKQHAQALVTHPTMSGAVLIKSGATLVLEECWVTSQTGHCVVVQVA